ncbi:MAG: HNH endonuclease signature motif containing protein [Bryobacteraceae bacterium]
MGLSDDIFALAQQLRLDTGLLYKEILWALGEERINRVTPTQVQFREWKRNNDGLMLFWSYANERLGCMLSQEDAHDIWQCIDLTLRTRERRGLSFEDYLMIAVRSDQTCAVCRQRPPEVKLEIDHILPVSRGGTEAVLNLRFLCESHNRSRGNRFHWADIWRYQAMARGQV